MTVAATGNTIGGAGGPSDPAYNVIAKNGAYGIWLTGATTGDLIQGNYLGYNSSGTPLFNTQAGLQVDSGTNGSNTGGSITVGTLIDAGTFTISGTATINNNLTVASGGTLNWDIPTSRPSPAPAPSATTACWSSTRPATLR